MIETLNLARKYTSTFSFRKYIFQCLGLLNFADVSIFLQKTRVFCLKKHIFTQSNSVRAVLEILQFFFAVFVRQKVTITEKITFADAVFGLRPPDCSKLAKKRKMTMTSEFSGMVSPSNFFEFALFLLSNLVTGPRLMSISWLVLEL